MLQTRVEDRLRGRVFAFFDVVWQTTHLASIAAGGLAADHVGIRAVYIAGGLLLITDGLLGLLLASPSDVDERAVPPDDAPAG